MRHFILITGTVLGLSACSTTNSVTQASLVTDDGTFLAPLVDAQPGTDRTDGTNNGYAFQVGFNQNRSGLESQAVLLNDISLPRPSVGGTTAMSGTYQLATLTDPVTNGGGLTATPGQQSGNITLTVDFDANTIAGSDNGLVLNGTFDADGQLAGTSSFDGMTGGIAGIVSNNTAIAIFARDATSTDTRGVFAGGLIVQR